jgi:uncharacterized protein
LQTIKFKSIPELGEYYFGTTFVMKVAGRCNLNCSYCYMYNKGDTTYTSRPRYMSREIAEASLGQIGAYASRHELNRIVLGIHGGEPLLIGREWMAWFLELARKTAESARVPFLVALQTNGVLLDEQWVELLASYDVLLGISADGPPEIHDLVRIDHAGRGSYTQVRRAIELLARSYPATWGILTVANPTIRGTEVLKHFLELGVGRIDFLWPEYHHDNLPPWPAGTLAKYYCDLFDYWYALASPPHIRWFETAMSLLLGRGWGFDGLGPDPVTDIMVESDGTWEPLDTLRTCGNGITRTGLDVRTNEVEAIWNVPLYQIGVQNQDLLPAVCKSCEYRHVCGGGYLPHRYSLAAGFSNPSVHCRDLYAVLSHIRQRMAFDLQNAGLTTLAG